MRRFFYFVITLVTLVAISACTEKENEERAQLVIPSLVIDNVAVEGVTDAEMNITARHLSSLKVEYDGAVVSKADITYEVVGGEYQFKIKYSVSENQTTERRTGWIDVLTNEFQPIRITVNQLPKKVLNRAYLGCLEVPELSLQASDPMIYSTPSYYGRHYEFNTTTPEQRVVVLQFNDYGSKSGVATGSWYRNYTMLYDNSMYAARWVAYSLSEWHFVLSSSIGRPGWIDNPALREYSGSYQENTTYDRGHQIANMMRNQCSSNAQQQTFFHANQMPQINKFNQGQWVALENKELVWKDECDTMYVVTGPIFDSNYKTTLDNGGTPIPVATRYFKAMIKCNWQSGELSDVKGIGFIFAHSASAQQYTEAKTSIAEIERVLNYKLFANLPSEFSQAKQNSTPSNFTNNW